MRQSLTANTLRKENLAFAGTAGVSEENQSSGFVPAFYDNESGKMAISRFTDGSPAACHLLDGIPDEWVLERDSSGKVRSTKSSVIAGFARQGRFYTREQAARALVH